MKLITRAEQIGLIWPSTARRARSILQQPKNTTEPQLLYRSASIEKYQLQMHGYSYIFLIYGAF